jgi:hypothetical protein
MEKIDIDKLGKQFALIYVATKVNELIDAYNEEHEQEELIEESEEENGLSKTNMG